MKNVLGALAVSTLLATANPTPGLAQNTAQTQTSINNCLNKEPLIKKMYDEVIMKKESYRKQKEGRIDELCNIMDIAKAYYTPEKLKYIIDESMPELRQIDGKLPEGYFTVILALLDREGKTEAGSLAVKQCKVAGSKLKEYFDLRVKEMDAKFMVDDIEKKLKKAQGN